MSRAMTLSIYGAAPPLVVVAAFGEDPHRLAGFLGEAGELGDESSGGGRTVWGISSSIATFHVTWPIATTADFLRGSSLTTRPGRS